MVSKLYYSFNPFVPTAPYEGALKLAEIAEKNSGTNGLRNMLVDWPSAAERNYDILLYTLL